MIRRAYQEFQVGDMLAWTMLFIIAMVAISEHWPTWRTVLRLA